jgi:ABC-type transport system involved in cytochrome c biogenesis permease component
MSEKSDADPKAREDFAARERIRYQWMLESVSKFRFFFAGLVFAMLSFSVQFAVQTTDRAARWCQALSWIFLALAGMLALRDAGGLMAKNTERIFDGLDPRTRQFMWICFILAVVLLAAARIFADGGLNQ